MAKKISEFKIYLRKIKHQHNPFKIPDVAIHRGGRWSVRLTKKLMKENHTELWMWLAGDPKRAKSGWPRWNINGGDIPYINYNDCFPCEYTSQHEINEDEWSSCRCPLDFPGWETTDGSHEYCLGGLYDKWCEAKGKARTALAKQIAELPIREKR